MRLNLISKLAIATGLVLLGTMALFAYLNFKNLKGLMLREAVSQADRISTTILKATHKQMLRDDRPQIYETMEEVGSQQGVVRIRLINKTGRIIFSSSDGEAGALLRPEDEVCAVCHAGPSPLLAASSHNRSRRFFDRSGEEFLGITSAIYNEEGCYTASCHFHPQGLKVLGVLDVVVPLDRMHSLLDAYRDRSIALTLLLITFTSLSLTFFTQRFVNRPVRELLEHTQMLSRGELDGLVHSCANDELGELADSFNDMTLNLRKARRDLEQWGRDLEEMVQQRTQEVTRMQAQLIQSEKLASLGELVAGIAHEINNPLTGILVFSSLIHGNPRLDETLRNDIETVIRETKRCAGIVKGLLEFARCSTPQKQAHRLQDICEAALALIQHQILFQDVHIERDYLANLPPLLLDGNQMEQVLINMLVNAGHAMLGEGVLGIATGLETGGDFAYVRISDNGCGIPPAHLSRIFDPFFSTKAARGTGLGLSVSYGIVQEHGGRIEVESAVGAGTVFTVLLPLAHGAKPSLDPAAPHPEHLPAKPPFSPAPEPYTPPTPPD